MNVDFSEILLEVVRRKASDLHITAGAPPMLRVRGSLVPVEGQQRLTATDTREIVYAILNSSQRQRLETDWQIDFAYSIPGHARFRVNAYFQRGTIGAAFRLIPAETVPIEKLGLPPTVREFATKPRGIVLVTGPTGSGKSTTLASIINEINETRDEHIMTIEDPIEFLHRHKKCIINQRELGGDAQSFAMALKAALRQDPDVILVGEMRDMETIGTALTAAETGHLVFATLHTQDAPQTVDRIIDVFPPAQQGQVRAQLAIGLQGIVYADARPDLGRQGGRTVAAEVLVPTPGVRNLIREGQDPPDLLADPDGRRARHADHGLLARRPRPRGQDHAGGRGDAAGRDRGDGDGDPDRPRRCVVSTLDRHHRVARSHARGGGGDRTGPMNPPTQAGAATRPKKGNGVTMPSRRGGSGRVLTDVIVDLGFVERDAMDEAVEMATSAGSAAERVLLSTGAITEEELARAVAERFGLDHLDLQAYRVDPDAAKLVSPAAIKRYQAVPVAFAGDRTLLVAMADPANVLAVDDIAVMTGYEVRPAVASPADIEFVVGRLADPNWGSGNGAAPEIETIEDEEPASGRRSRRARSTTSRRRP